VLRFDWGDVAEQTAQVYAELAAGSERGGLRAARRS
jgi:hypothetical protein